MGGETLLIKLVKGIIGQVSQIKTGRLYIHFAPLRQHQVCISPDDVLIVRQIYTDSLIEFPVKRGQV